MFAVACRVEFRIVAAPPLPRLSTVLICTVPVLTRALPPMVVPPV